MVEAVTGHEVTAEIRRRILEPLGMQQTFMESFEPIPGDIAHHYHYATPTFVREAGVHRAFPEIRPYIVDINRGEFVTGMGGGRHGGLCG